MWTTVVGGTGGPLVGVGMSQYRATSAKGAGISMYGGDEMPTMQGYETRVSPLAARSSSW